jgi:plastocyanin
MRAAVSSFVLACLSAVALPIAHAADLPVTWDFAVIPTSGTISVGDSVTWSGDLGVHPIRETNSTFSGTAPAFTSGGNSFQKFFPTPGTFYFQCTAHGFMQFKVIVCSAPPATLAALDIDGNGQVDAATDGLLVVRYLLGLRGDALIAGALGVSPSRCTFEKVETYLAQLNTP